MCFQKAHADTLRALSDEEKKILAQIDEKQTQFNKRQEKEVAITYNKIANAVSQNVTKIYGLTRQLQGKETDIFNVAEYLHFGEFRLAGKSLGLNRDLEFPCIIPFISNSNIFVTSTKDLLSELCQYILWHSLEQTAAGQVQIIAYNSDLANTMSPFASLGKDCNALRVISQPEELEAVLLELIKDVQSTTDLMRGTTKSLVEFRKKTNQPIGIYRIVVLLDFPKGIDERSFSTLLSLAKSAPNAGVSFLFMHNADIAHPQWIHVEELKKSCTALRADDTRCICESIKNLEICIPKVEIEKIVTGVDDLVFRIAKEFTPPVLFTKLESTNTAWLASSAEGISFVLGSSGLDPIEVRLGDEKSQKHNVLISGAVGQGKSNLIKVIIHSLCSRYSPDELNLYLLDFKEGVTLFPFSNLGTPDYLPHAKVLGLESDRDFGLAVLSYLENEFNRRAKLFKKYGDNIAKYRAANPNDVMPRIVLIIDEFHFMFNINDELGEKAANKLEALARKGRAYGIHLILASQSITGASALLIKEDGVFGQFPIRIALKNHLAESYATFVQGNDAATKLRIRGQAVINSDYGSIDSNQFFMVAWASDGDFNDMRKEWWKRAKEATVPPMIFNGGDRLRISKSVLSLRNYREKIITEGNNPVVLLGNPISVIQNPVAISMSDDAGRNIAILGAGDSETLNLHDDKATNNAIGIIQSIAISLALQHSNGNARFIAFDLLDKVLAKNNNQDLWLSLMERLGFPIELVQKNDVPETLNNLASSLADRSDTDDIVYILGFAMDRSGNIGKQDPISLASALDSFRQILREGSMRGVHFIGWWSNIASYSSHIGYGNEGYIETKIILRLDESATQSVLGPFVHWSVRENRALVLDQTQLTEILTIIPFSPITKEDVQKITSSYWGEA